MSLGLPPPPCSQPQVGSGSDSQALLHRALGGEGTDHFQRAPRLPEGEGGQPWARESSWNFCVCSLSSSLQNRQDRKPVLAWNLAPRAGSVTSVTKGHLLCEDQGPFLRGPSPLGKVHPAWISSKICRCGFGQDGGGLGRREGR